MPRELDWVPTGRKRKVVEGRFPPPPEEPVDDTDDDAVDAEVVDLHGHHWYLDEDAGGWVPVDPAWHPELQEVTTWYQFCDGVPAPYAPIRLVAVGNAWFISDPEAEGTVTLIVTNDPNVAWQAFRDSCAGPDWSYDPDEYDPVEERCTWYTPTPCPGVPAPLPADRGESDGSPDPPAG